MNRWAAQWWDNLSIQRKVWAVLLLLCVPLVGGLATHLYLVQQLLAVQQQRQELVLAHDQVQVLRRLAVDIEDAFRGYVLTEQSAFLAPLNDAEARLDESFANTGKALANLPRPTISLVQIERRVKNLLRSKRDLIADIEQGTAD